MQLHSLKTFATDGRQCVGSKVFAAPIWVLPGGHRLPPAQHVRDVSAASSKATTLTDLGDAVARPNPERRVLRDINFHDMVRQAPDWPALQRLEVDVRDRYERQPALAVAVVSRAAELVDMDTAPAATRAAVRRMLDSGVAPFIVEKGIFNYRAGVLPHLLGSLAALQYAGNARLNTALGRLLEASARHLEADALCAAAASATACGVRLKRDGLDAVADRLGWCAKWLTAQDVANLAAALAPYGRLPARLDRELAGTLAAAVGRELPARGLAGEQLVDVLALFTRLDYPLSPSWVAAYQAALLDALPRLTAPRAYASLLFSLAKGSLAITADFLAALLERTAQPADPARAAAALPVRSLLRAMPGPDLAVVAAVLSIYGYGDVGEAWQAEYCAALEERAGELDGKQVVTILDATAELGIALPPDTMDELLAVAEGAEGGLAALGASRLARLAGALAAAGHEPDRVWLRALQAALTELAGRAAAGAELAQLVAVLPALPAAYPAGGPAAAAVLAAVKARATTLGGFDGAARRSIEQSLRKAGQADAAAFASSLLPPPPPPPPPPQPEPAPAPAAAPAAAAKRTRAAATAAAAPPPAPPPPPAAPPLVASTRTAAAPAARPAAAVTAPQPAAGRAAAGRPPAYEDDEDELEEYEDEDEEEEYEEPAPQPAARRAAATAAPSRPAARAPPPPPAAPPPPPPPPPPPAPPAGDGLVASTRQRRGGRR